MASPRRGYALLLGRITNYNTGGLTSRFPALRRHRRRRSAVSRRWQIINIHYVLTKLSHKLRARGKNGTADNGRADKQPDETDATVQRCSVRCSNVCLS